jgi:CDP-diacylglycerol--serine O-phosphatidyltransferase
MDPHAAHAGNPSNGPSGAPSTAPAAPRAGAGTAPAAPSIRASGPLRKSDIRDPRLDRDTRRLLKKQFKLEQKLLRQQFRLERREHRRLRLRRHGRRAYIRSAYSLPSLATLGNAVCGFGAMYVATLDDARVGIDPWTRFFHEHHFIAAAYLIFVAMLFDALDGRLARFTRHTTDFGGQLDSLADVISFGAAPALLALEVMKSSLPLPAFFGRLFWAFGALYMSCAAIRLARFNVSNEHGEQHHFSFLGLPSPGAGGAVAAFILMQQDLYHWSLSLRGTNPSVATFVGMLSLVCLWLLPVIVAATGLLMVSTIRYPHLVNRYLRGRRSLGRLVLALVILLGFVVAHRYVLGLGMLAYVLWGLLGWGYLRARPRAAREKTGMVDRARDAPTPATAVVASEARPSGLSDSPRTT